MTILCIRSNSLTVVSSNKINKIESNKGDHLSEEGSGSKTSAMSPAKKEVPLSPSGDLVALHVKIVRSTEGRSAARQNRARKGTGYKVTGLYNNSVKSDQLYAMHILTIKLICKTLM